MCNNLQRKKTVLIDGSYGEGGGQILRTAVTLSAITQQSIKISNIRARRKNPGIRPQHIGSIQIVASLCNANVKGLHIGSTEVLFQPQKIKPSSLIYDVGSAGSLTLLLQAVIPVASMAHTKSVFQLKGGTDVKWSPSLDYFSQVYIPILKELGYQVNVKVQRRGFYPKGGGILDVEIKSANRLFSINLLNYEKKPVHVYSVSSLLSHDVATRQLNAALDKLNSCKIPLLNTLVKEEKAISPGTALTIFSVHNKSHFLGADSLGERGKPAEKVGIEAAERFISEWLSNSTVDSHLADMLVVPLSLAEGSSILRISNITNHLKTNLYITSLLTGCKYKFETRSGATNLVLNPELNHKELFK